MCGIVGQLTYAERGDPIEDRRVIEALVGVAARRGPDGEGLWSDERHCTLGFRRLAIFDLSDAARQPMLSADGRFALIYNGALYNFRELRHDLEATGSRFRSSGDSEVVLQALATWGKRALERFNGMFALGFYDLRERRLLLARDHAGMKPLYYLHLPSGIVFASQFDQIVLHPWARSLEYSSAALALYLRLGYVPPPFALLQHAHQIEPGGWLEVAADGSSDSGRYYKYPVYRAPDLSGAAAYEAVDEVLRSSVRRHLLADVPVGTFLSGGVDSPLIAGLVREVASSPVPAFTLSTGGDEHDESTEAAAYARELGAEHTVGVLDQEGALAMVDDVIAALAEPFADYSIFPTLFVSRLARQRVKVVLVGDGGDELFFGYVGRFSAVMRRFLAAQGAAAQSLSRLRQILSAGVGREAGWPTSIGDLYRLNHARSTDGWLRQVFPGLPPWPDDFTLFRFDGWEADRVAQWIRWNELSGYLVMLLQKVDRGSMYESLEARVPFLDREVIDVATRVDWRSNLDPTQQVGKLALRHSLAKRVRSQTWAKRGFTVGMSEWLRGSLRPIFEAEVLSRDHLGGLEVDRRGIAEHYRQHLEGQADYGWNLWMLLTLALWESRYDVRRRTR